MYVCLCHGVSDKKIKKLAIDEGVTDIRGIKQCTALGSQCGKCIRQAKDILAETETRYTGLKLQQAS
ncbi:bacterioferritin-associated ferredoxin [Vibrio sp. ES.051]|uniref:(2Fe-2S)-binding protein n=1 Tax=Vibrio sp. ES.051 TaxID=1761909 RepID=UPI000BF39C57|nr:(2Fe-2S)-binding protein [Vibrio sp. ES.051]PFG55133.1 bacterioferritin-associated ferredoxin [Vibrio sp. ES.051]